MWYIILCIFGLAPILTAATMLDLSRQGLTKEKFFRGNNGSVLSGVENATELNLQGNSFDSFLDCSANLTKLEILDLSQNLLQRFFFVCKQEDNLIKLNVSYNRLPFLNETALTDRITKLQVLDLSHNLVSFVTQQTFQHLENLKILALNENPIGNHIDYRAFSNLTSLVDLNLRNISVSRLPIDLFTPLVSLRFLNLAWNPLEEVPILPTWIESLDISGTNIFQLGAINIPQLKILAMNFMPRLESLNLKEFVNLGNLNVLSIENCPTFKKLTVEPPADDILPKINHISIRNCSIDSLGHELQPVMQRAFELDLQNNPWHCDCEMRWIRSLKLNTNYSTEMRCKTPSELAEKRVFEISEEQFECSRINYFALWLVLGLLVVAAVAGWAFYARGSLIQWHKQSRRRDRVTYKNMAVDANEAGKILDQCDISDYP